MAAMDLHQPIGFDPLLLQEAEDHSGDGGEHQGQGGNRHDGAVGTTGRFEHDSWGSEDVGIGRNRSGLIPGVRLEKAAENSMGSDA